MDAYARAATENLHLLWNKKKDHAKVYLGYCKVSEVAVIDALSLGAAKTWLTTQENTQLQFQQIGKSR
jgi:hypothetical protein